MAWFSYIAFVGNRKQVQAYREQVKCNNQLKLVITCAVMGKLYWLSNWRAVYQVIFYPISKDKCI